MSKEREARGFGGGRRHGGGPGGPGGHMLREKVKLKDSKGTIRRLWRYLKDKRFLLALVALFSLISSAVSIVGIRINGSVVDDYVAVGDLTGLIRICLILIGMYLVSTAIVFVQSRLMIRISQNTTDVYKRQEMKPMFTDATAARIIKVRVQNPNFEDRTGEGTVTITPRPLTITAGSASKRHDGQPLTDASYTITGGSLAEEQELTSVTVTGSQTDVGSSANVPSAAVIKTIVPETAEAQTPREVTANYAITYLNGTLTVTRRSSGGGGDPTPTPEPERCV